MQVTNTSLNWQFWFFEPNLPKWNLRWKLKQVNIAIELCIFELVYVPNFSWNWQFCFFGPSLPKKGYLQSKTEKLNKHHHWILYVRIRLRTKFQLKLAILIFRPNLPNKGISGRKRKNHMCVRPWSLLTILNFSARDRQTQRYFNVSSPSSRRDNYRIIVQKNKLCHAKQQ